MNFKSYWELDHLLDIGYLSRSVHEIDEAFHKFL